MKDPVDRGAASCLAETTVQGFMAGALSPAEVAAVDDHVESCPSCRQLVRALARGTGDPALDATVVDAGTRAPRLAAGALDRGAQLGRYLILDVLGQGGMGVVYAAYDPELDRKIALKLLHAELSQDGVGAQRMLREGRAIAKLSHPNVVAVHDVGTHDGAVFVAMELVPGASLDRYLAERVRPWRDVLAVMLQAGDGLVAAHQAGMVHRDIKPQNILVGADGRARVTDFGLARVTAGPAASGEQRDDAAPPRWTSDVRLTRTGAVVGTPAYMALEQLEGRTVDARTDQFSFAASLYEALYGERPFAGLTIGELAAALAANAVRPPTSREVPAWLRACVVRALRAEPDERYPTLAAFLTELRRDRSRRSLWIGATAALALAGTVVTLSLRPGDTESPTCALAAAPVVRAWNPVQRARVVAGLSATGASGHGAVAQRVAANLDEYSAGLAEMYGESCRATHVTQTQSPASLDLRTQCLDRRVGDLAALVDVFAATRDPAIVLVAIQASRALGSPAPCADTKALGEVVPLPQDPGVRAELDRLQPRLAQLKARLIAGQFKSSLADVEALAVAAEQVAYPPFAASALSMLAEIQSRLNQPQVADATMERSIDAAARGRDHRQVAYGYAWRVTNVGMNLGKHAEALALADVAAHANDQAGTDPLIAAKIHSARAIMLTALGRMPEAIAEEASAYTIREKLGEPLGLARAHLSYATALLESGDEAAAAPHFAAAKAGLEKALHPDHPELVGLLHNYGSLLLHQGKLAESRAVNERAVTIAKQAYGPASTLLAAPMNNLGELAIVEGRYADAIAIYQQLQEWMTGVLDPAHPFWGIIDTSLGRAYLAQGDVAHARPAFEKALAHLEPLLGPTHDSLSEPILGLAQIHERDGDHARADAEFTRAIALDGTLYTNASSAYGGALLDRGDAQAARKVLEAAQVINDQRGKRTAHVARTQLRLARARWATATRDAATVALVESGLAMVLALTPPDEVLAGELRAWLASHRPD